MEKDEAKAWLRQLRVEHGYTQKELGTLVGVSDRVILEAEKPGAGWPGGFTVLRMLQELGVVAGVHGQTRSPLANLEAMVAEGAEQTARSLEGIAAGIARLEDLLDDEDGRHRAVAR